MASESVSELLHTFLQAHLWNKFDSQNVVSWKSWELLNGLSGCDWKGRQTPLLFPTYIQRQGRSREDPSNVGSPWDLSVIAGPVA